MRSVLLISAAAALMLAPARSDGQIGRLIKKKVAEATVEKAAESAGLSTRGVREDNTLQFDDRIIEITGERIVGFMKGVDAEAAAAARYRSEFAAAQARFNAELSKDEAKRRAFEQAQEEYSTRNEAYRACLTASGEQLGRVGMAMLTNELMVLNQRMAALPDAQRTALESRLEQYEKRAKAAEARNDVAAAHAIRRELVADMARTLNMTESDVEKAMHVPAGGGDAIRAAAGGPQACGPAPTAPAAPPGLAAENPETTMGSMENYVAREAARASGLTQQQYWVMRERVVAFLKNHDGVSFTGSELSALRTNEAALRRYESKLTS